MVSGDVGECVGVMNLKLFFEFCIYIGLIEFMCLVGVFISFLSILIEVSEEICIVLFLEVVIVFAEIFRRVGVGM